MVPGTMDNIYGSRFVYACSYTNPDSFSYSAPGGRTFQRVQVPNPPGSGKDIANGKGVVGDCESEGSRMANLWSDVQKSH